MDRAVRARDELASAMGVSVVVPDVQPAPAQEADALASLKAAGVTLADQGQEGHGVSRSVIERARAMAQG